VPDIESLDSFNEVNSRDYSKSGKRFLMNTKENGRME